MILGMHAAVRSRVRDVLAELYGLDSGRLPDVAIQYPPDRSMGDLGVTVAFELARVLRKAPRAIAAEIVGALGPIDGVERVEPAPNGYVNLFLDRARFARAALRPPPAPAARGIRKAIVEHTAINPNKAAPRRTPAQRRAGRHPRAPVALPRHARGGPELHRRHRGPGGGRGGRLPAPGAAAAGRGRRARRAASLRLLLLGPLRAGDCLVRRGSRPARAPGPARCTTWRPMSPRPPGSDT